MTVSTPPILDDVSMQGIRDALGLSVSDTLYVRALWNEDEDIFEMDARLFNRSDLRDNATHTRVSEGAIGKGVKFPIEDGLTLHLEVLHKSPSKIKYATAIYDQDDDGGFTCRVSYV